MARVRTSGSLSRAGRPVLGGREACSSFHQSSTSTYNETKKESRSMSAPSFGESLVQHTIWAPSPLASVTHHSSKSVPAVAQSLAYPPSPALSSCSRSVDSARSVSSARASEWGPSGISATFTSHLSQHLHTPERDGVERASC